MGKLSFAVCDVVMPLAFIHTAIVKFLDSKTFSYTILKVPRIAYWESIWRCLEVPRAPFSWFPILYNCAG
jgi:hypothetical protein